jgi:exopolysaccharide production protein ExoQ
MPPIVATVVFAIGIAALFHLDRGHGPVLSKALAIPAVWLFLICSRPVSLWLQMPQEFSASPEAYMEGSPIDRAVYMFLLFATLAVLVKRIDRVGLILRENAPMVLFFSFCAFSVLWSQFPLVAFKRFAKAIGDVGMILIILTEPDPLAALKKLFARLGFLLFPLSVLFIKYYPLLGDRLTNSWTREATGVAMQKNGLGMDCMIYGIFFLWMFRSVYRERPNASRNRYLLAYGTIIAMIIWLLCICNSMTSIAGLAMAGGVTWITVSSSRKPAAVHLLVLTVLGICLTAMFFDSGGTLVGALGRDPSLTGRTEIWRLVLSMHTNPWIGTGFESFWLGRRLVEIWKALPNLSITSPHNGFLEVYLNLGWVGVLFIAILLVTGYRKLISALRQNPGDASLLLGFFVASLINSLTEAGFRSMSITWISLLLGIMAASQSVVSRRGPQAGKSPAFDIATDLKPVHAAKGASILFYRTGDILLRRKPPNV